MLVIDRHGKLLHSNPAAARLLDGRSVSPGAEVFELLARQLRSGDGRPDPDAWTIERDLMSGGRPGGPTLYRLDGDPGRFIEIHVVPIPDRSGRRLGTGLRLRDVTALRHAREQLREQAAVLEAILGSAGQGMLVVDSKGEMIYSNRAFRELWSVLDADRDLSDSDASLSQVVSQMVDPEDFLGELASIDDGRVDTSRREMLLRDGRIVERSSRPLLLDRTIAGRVWSFFDVTADRVAERERHQLERQMLQAQKMESLGILAGGIAHDFNNLLVGILGNADLALASVDRDAPLHEPLTDIADASRRAAELTNQMLAYSGRSRFILETIDLPGLTRETQHLIEAVISKSARVELDLKPVSPIEGDPAQLRQVIMNLITNASDALKGSPGRIRVSTRDVDVGPDELADYELGDSVDAGPFVCLEVSDTGAGMDDEIASRIFDPFFTTKFTGRGLGLSAVLGIVRAHRGAIRVDSRPSRGTTIRMLLPPSLGSVVSVDAVRPSRPPVAGWRGRGTILVADDEPTVLRVVGRTLERAGFDVVTATNGRVALERWAEHGGDFVAVLLDMTMPEQGGLETLVALRASGADVPVVLSSGYSEDEAQAQLDGERPDAFLQKPYATHVLLETLRSVIAGDDR
jgi:signal transduction histidine kinase/CheY-like chemotaxis protein